MESETSPCTIRTESWSCSGKTGNELGHRASPGVLNSDVNRLAPLLRKLAGLLTRVRLPTDPIPATWPEVVDRRVPLIARLPSADQERLYHIMQLFLKEVPFEEELHDVIEALL